MSFDPAQYLASFSPDAYLERFEAKPKLRAAQRTCRRCGRLGHNVKTCDVGEVDRVILIAERAQQLDQARRLAMNGSSPSVERSEPIVNETAPARDEPAVPRDDGPLTADDMAFWDEEIARLPDEPTCTKEPVLVQAPVAPATNERSSDDIPATAPVVLGFLAGKRELGHTVDGRVRAKTIPPHRLFGTEKAAAIPYPDDVERPRTRADCVDGPRPCPWVGCRQHLYLDVTGDAGAIKINFPHLEVWQLRQSCALDVADEGGKTLEELGVIVNITRERIRQIEVTALAKMADSGAAELDLAPEQPISMLEVAETG